MTDTYRDDGAGGAESGGGADTREALAHATQTVKQEAAHFAGAARDRAMEKAEAQAETVTTALADFADVIRKAGEELGQRDQGMAAGLAAQAADGLQAFARNLSEQRPQDMLHAVRDFGRANPTAFLAGAVLAGLAVGRFARSSAGHTHGAATTAATGQTMAEPGPLETYETPGVADPYAADLASGFDASSGMTPESSQDMAAGAENVGLEDLAPPAPSGEPSPDIGLGATSDPEKEG